MVVPCQIRTVAGGVFTVIAACLSQRVYNECKGLWLWELLRTVMSVPAKVPASMSLGLGLGIYLPT